MTSDPGNLKSQKDGFFSLGIKLTFLKMFYISQICQIPEGYMCTLRHLYPIKRFYTISQHGHSKARSRQYVYPMTLYQQPA